MVGMKGSAGRILMLVENPFPGDPRVRNEALLLSSAGYSVSVIALRDKKEAFRDEFQGVTIYRLPELVLFDKTSLSKTTFLQRLAGKLKAIAGYVIEYIYFTAGCFCISLYLSLTKGFDVIHAHNPPDTLFVVGRFFKLFGKKYVFDHHDLSPELYLSRFGKSGGFLHRVLLWVERRVYRTADVVIATNESYKKTAMSRGKKAADSIYVVRNGPDLDRFRMEEPDHGLKRMGKTILGYVGEINPQDGLDYLLRSLRLLVYELKRTDFYCVIIGSGDALPNLVVMARELGIEDYVRFTGYVSHTDLLRLLSSADICVDPDPSSPLNDVSTWIKIMEYMALAKPIVTFDLKETRFSARDAALYVKPNDELAFAQAIVSLMDDAVLRAEMGLYGRQRILSDLRWSKVSQPLLHAYEQLLGKSVPDSTEIPGLTEVFHSR